MSRLWCNLDWRRTRPSVDSEGYPVLSCRCTGIFCRFQDSEVPMRTQTPVGYLKLNHFNMGWGYLSREKHSFFLLFKHPSPSPSLSKNQTSYITKINPKGRPNCCLHLLLLIIPFPSFSFFSYLSFSVMISFVSSLHFHLLRCLHHSLKIILLIAIFLTVLLRFNVHTLKFFNIISIIQLLSMFRRIRSIYYK
jgi:hypothetical protein